MPDVFQTDIDAIVRQVNEMRVKSLGHDWVDPSALESELPVGVPGIRIPWLTFSVLALLVAIYALECFLSPASEWGKGPPVTKLFAMGALNQRAVLVDGEWYRLFIAPLLHGNAAHLLGNGIALLVGGWTLEALVGRAWLLCYLVLGALGGSIASVLISGYNVSVGASGPLMGLFAVMLMISIRFRSVPEKASRLLRQSLTTLIPSLVPAFSGSAGSHIDYGAHAGGAFVGAVLALVMLKPWPRNAPVPPMRRFASAVCVVGCLLFSISAARVATTFPDHNVALIPPQEMPKNVLDGQHAAELASRYPNDPRSHLLLAKTFEDQHHDADVERELRIALVKAHLPLFDRKLESGLRSALVQFLLEKNRRDEAMDIISARCRSLPENPTPQESSAFLESLKTCN